MARPGKRQRPRLDSPARGRAARTEEPLEADHAKAVGLLEQGRGFLNSGEIPEARRLLLEAVSTDPDLAAGHYFLACLALRDGAPREAVQHAERAIRLEPEQSDYLNVWGAASYEAGDLAAAEGAFRRAIELNEGNGEAWSNLGQILDAAGRKPEADEARARLDVLLRPGPLPSSGQAEVRVDRQSPKRLNVGCGDRRIPGWIGIDIVKTPATDIVRDIRRGLPYDDSSVDEILCDNVLEHIGPPEDFIFVLNEFHRVLKPGAVATIIVPDGRSQAAWQDPTHQRAFVPRSALYWNQDLPWPKLYGITADFDVTIQGYGDMNSEAFLKFICKARPKPTVT